MRGHYFQYFQFIIIESVDGHEAYALFTGEIFIGNPHFKKFQLVVFKRFLFDLVV